MKLEILIDELKQRTEKEACFLLESEKRRKEEIFSAEHVLLAKTREIKKLDGKFFEFNSPKELQIALEKFSISAILKTASGIEFAFQPEEVHVSAVLETVKSAKQRGESEPALEHQAGLYLTPPHGLYIWDGRKTAIVKSKKFLSYVDKPLYLLSGKLCYGIIKFGSPKEINLNTFQKLFVKHHVSEPERRKWWPEIETFYYYPVTMIRKWDPPRKWKVQKGPQVFVKDVKFKEKKSEDETREESIEQEMKEFGNWYLVRQPKSKDFKYVAQYHFRGNSLHVDLRAEANEHLVGWTLNTPEVPEDSKTPQADYAFTKNCKFLYPRSPSLGANYQILVERKLVQPKIWLTVKGKIPIGGIGATRFLSAEFKIISKGTMRFGTCKTDFNEILLKPDGTNPQDKNIKGRWIIALIPRPQHYKRAGEGKMMWGMFKSKKDAPYIDYHNFEKEKAKALREKIDMIWQNFDGEDFQVVAGKENLPKGLEKKT